MRRPALQEVFNECDKFKIDDPNMAAVGSNANELMHIAWHSAQHIMRDPAFHKTHHFLEFFAGHCELTKACWRREL